MDDKIIAAALGALFGFALPYLAGVWDRIRRARRMVSALDRELSEAAADIERKLAWVSRNVTESPEQVDADRTVQTNGTRLYLGEREEFAVPRAYWKAKYTEIAEAVSNRDFSDFYVMHRLVDSFEQKFREMKQAFDNAWGTKDAMALACFGDLTAISKDLRNKLAGRAQGRL
jgi:hypothetical protein